MIERRGVLGVAVMATISTALAVHPPFPARSLPMVMDTMASLAEPYRSGQVRILTNFSAQCSAVFPDIPTAVEQGLSGMTMD